MNELIIARLHPACNPPMEEKSNIPVSDKPPNARPKYLRINGLNFLGNDHKACSPGAQRLGFILPIDQTGGFASSKK